MITYRVLVHVSGSLRHDEQELLIDIPGVLPSTLKLDDIVSQLRSPLDRLSVGDVMRIQITHGSRS